MKKRNLVALVIMLLMVMAVPALAEEVGDSPAPFRIDLTGIAQAIIALLVTLVTHKLIPWIKARTTAEQQSNLLLITRTLVYAAEQKYRNEVKSGKKKLMYVKSQLNMRGYDIDLDAIEAMVKELSLEESWVEEDSVGIVDDEDDDPPVSPDNPEA